MWDLKFPDQGSNASPLRWILNHWTTREVTSPIFFFFLDFLMWASFKVFIEFVTILLLFYVSGFFATRHVRS